MTQIPRAWRVVVLTILLVGIACGACGSDDGSEPAQPRNPLGANGHEPPKPPQWELTAVPAELLDRIQAELGRRAGVRVERVRESSAAASAGIRDGDVLLAVNGVPVGSPAAVEAALRGRSGAVELVLLRIAADGAWTIPQVTLVLPAATPAAPPPPPTSNPAPQGTAPAPPPASTAATPVSSLRDVVSAYFDMLDFARTEGWGRKSVTPEAVRSYAEGQLRQNLSELDAPTRAVIEQIPESWATLRARWSSAAEGERQRQRAFWKGRMLLPNPLLPLPGELTTFRSEGGGHAFEHPADWVVAQGRFEDTGLLYLGPAGTQTTWEQVVDPTTSPPGVLFAISPTDEGLRAVSSPEEGARYVGRKYVTGRAPGMEEVVAFRLGTGALVLYVGRWPGRAEESFCWVGAMPFGNDKFIAGRFSGPVAQAETLLPAFSVILATTEVTPPDDLASLHVELAAAMIGNAVVSTGWSD